MRQLERQLETLSAPDAALTQNESREPGTSHEDLLPAHQPDLPMEGNTFSQKQLFAPHTHNPPVRYGAEPNLIEANSPSRSPAGGSKEVTGINPHTRNVEFYGRSSSMALLGRVQKNGAGVVVRQDADEEEGSLVSILHNPVFSPTSTATSRLEIPAHNAPAYYQQCRSFLNDFFGTIHYIHPILDKASFLARCENLWFGEPCTQSQSFKAVYYSILSLGALVGVRDDEPIDAAGNLGWSRKFFDEARALSGGLNLTTDLEMVQCFFFLVRTGPSRWLLLADQTGKNMSERTQSSLYVKIDLFSVTPLRDSCDHLLSQLGSYMYVGLAVRTALAIGINREPPPGSKKDSALLKAESRTWWSVLLKSIINQILYPKAYYCSRCQGSIFIRNVRHSVRELSPKLTKC